MRFKYRGRNLRHGNSSFYCDQDHFAHDPPGHTCGLPCCNSDLHIHMKVEGHQGGCIAIPFLQRKIIQDNFTLRHNQIGLIKGVPTFNNGFYSLQPEKAPHRKPLPMFGTVRSAHGNNPTSKNQAESEMSLDHELAQNQDHYLRGREITLPRFQANGSDDSPFSIYLIDNELGEHIDTDTSESSSEDSDTGYYTSIASVTNEDVENKNLTHRLIYPWDMLRASQSEAAETNKFNNEDSIYYDIVTDKTSIKKLERVHLEKQVNASRNNERNRKTRSLVHTPRRSVSDFKSNGIYKNGTTQSLQRVDSYCTLSFENNLFSKSKTLPNGKSKINVNLQSQCLSNKNENHKQSRSSEKINNLIKTPHSPSEVINSNIHQGSKVNVPRKATDLSIINHSQPNKSSKPALPKKPKPCKQPQIPASFMLGIQGQDPDNRKDNVYVALNHTEKNKSDLSGNKEGEYTQLSCSADASNFAKPEIKNSIHTSRKSNSVPPPLPKRASSLDDHSPQETIQLRPEISKDSQFYGKSETTTDNLNEDPKVDECIDSKVVCYKSSEIRSIQSSRLINLNDLSHPHTGPGEKDSLVLKVKNIDVVNTTKDQTNSGAGADGAAVQCLNQAKSMSCVLDKMPFDDQQKGDNPITLIL